ncbi:MAG: Na/Pi cotransporter family protein [Bdellovibrionia bacterium]
MTGIQAFNALAGVGLFFFSLRLLTQAIDEAVSAHIEPTVRWVGQGFLKPIGAGVGLTVLLQASSLTIVSAMGFLGRGWITLEHGLLLSLGAAFGSTLKAWFFASNPKFIGPGLIVLSSVLMTFYRRRVARKSLELILAVGLIFVSWNFMGEALDQLTSVQTNWGPRSFLNGGSFFHLLFFLGIGFFLTLLVQSSSTVVFLIIGLANGGSLSVYAATAMILGANVGTSITGLIFSLGYRSEVKRLALGHFLIKSVGALMSLLLFKTFLSVVALITSPLLSFFHLTLHPGHQLAAVHSVYNALNLLIWSILMPFLVKVLHVLLPEKDNAAQVWMPAVVRKMLMNLPARAFEETNRRQGTLLSEAKVLTHDLFQAIESVHQPGQIQLLRIEFSGRFRVLEELLANLAVSQKNQHSLSCWSRLGVMDRFEKVVHELWELHEMISLAPENQRRTVQDVFGSDLARLKNHFLLAWNELRAGRNCEPTCLGAGQVLSEVERRMCCPEFLVNRSIGISEFLLLRRVVSCFSRVLLELACLGQLGMGKSETESECCPPNSLPWRGGGSRVSSVHSSSRLLF